MLLPDVNVLIYAHREDGHPEHPRFAAWLSALASGPEPFALSVLVMVGLVRIVTNPRIFKRPSTLAEALDFATELVRRPTARVVGPGPLHWELVADLCREAGATGKLVADAQHAAVAIEHGCTLVTTDGDFARFRRLRWHHPLAPVGTAAERPSLSELRQRLAQRSRVTPDESPGEAVRAERNAR